MTVETRLSTPTLVLALGMVALACAPSMEIASPEPRAEPDVAVDPDPKMPTGTEPEPGVPSGEGAPPCTDLPPDDQYTCPEQAGWGKCNEAWMLDFCHESCGRCTKPPPAPIEPELFTHRGQKIFLTGVNIGHVHFLPFAQSPYAQSPKELRAMLASALADLKSWGVNSIRFWIHIDGSQSPTWAPNPVTGAPDLVAGLPDGFIDDLKWLIRTAYLENGLLVNATLWSHDVLAVRRLNPVANRDRAVFMMTDARATQAYIDNALIPMLRALKAPMADGLTYQDGVMSWEVFNEPEGISAHWRLYWNYQYVMQHGEYTWLDVPYLKVPSRAQHVGKSEDGWRTERYLGWYFRGDPTVVPSSDDFNLYMYKDVTDYYPTEWDYLKKAIVDDGTLRTVDVSHRDVMRFINRVAGAIHREVPGAQVSAGAHSMPYNTNTAMPGLGYENAPFNYYADSELIAAGGDRDGHLDFYQVHGYPDWSDARKDQLFDMFKNPKPHWGLDKPVMIGEHWEEIMTAVAGQKVYAKPEHYTYLHDQGYAGAWGWAYFDTRELAADCDPAFVACRRRVVEHTCRARFRDELYTRLPERLRYPVDTRPNTGGP